MSRRLLSHKAGSRQSWVVRGAAFVLVALMGLLGMGIARADQPSALEVAQSQPIMGTWTSNGDTLKVVFAVSNSTYEGHLTTSSDPCLGPEPIIWSDLVGSGSSYQFARFDQFGSGRLVVYDKATCGIERVAGTVTVAADGNSLTESMGSYGSRVWTRVGSAPTPRPTSDASPEASASPTPGLSPGPSATPSPDVDCGENGTLTAADVEKLVAAGLVPAGDPCALEAVVEPVQAQVAGPGGGVLRTSDGAVWEVLEKQEVQESAAGGRFSMCYRLRGTAPVSLTKGQMGTVGITQRICKSRDFIRLLWVLSDGTYNPATNRWNPPTAPLVDVKSNEFLVGLSNGGPGGNGVGGASRVPFNGQVDGGWEVQVQVVMSVGLGVPKGEGLFVGYQKTLQKEFKITVDDLESPQS